MKTINIDGQISIFDIMPYIKETENDKQQAHNCPFYMFIKDGVPYAKKTCTTDWTECGQCSMSKDFYKERNRLMESGLGLIKAIDLAREFIYEKYGRGEENVSIPA